MTLYTIGHSTRTIDDLIQTLMAHQIQTLVDIRAFPMSKRLPQFNRESLEKTLPGSGISYVWMQTLGGYRKKILPESPNIALRHDSFRNYADYMLTPEFENASAELLQLVAQLKTVYMCVEWVYFCCHCMLVLDWLITHQQDMQHIDGTNPTKPHRLTTEARMIEGRLIYRGDRLL